MLSDPNNRERLEAEARAAGPGETTDYLRLAAVEYSFDLLKYFLGRLLDGGHLREQVVPLLDDILTIARSRPQSLP